MDALTELRVELPGVDWQPARHGFVGRAPTGVIVVTGPSEFDPPWNATWHGRGVVADGEGRRPLSAVLALASTLHGAVTEWQTIAAHRGATVVVVAGRVVVVPKGL